MFATISGAHLHGFPSPDSDFDLRGAQVLPLEGVVGLADALGIQMVWGECTKNSAAFHAKVLDLLKVTDHCLVRGEAMAHCLEQHLRAR